jgi:hypothetical protein
MWNRIQPSALAALIATTVFLAPQPVDADDDSDVPDSSQREALIEQEFAEKIEQYNRLLKQNRFDEAITLGEEAQILRPDNPVHELMVFKAKFAKEDAVNRLCGTIKATMKAEVSEDLARLHAPHDVLRIAVETIDQLANGNDEAFSAARCLLNVALERRIHSVDHVCRLTDQQQRKLLLAGRGDIKRFFDRVEGLRPKVDRGPGEQDDILILCGISDLPDADALQAARWRPLFEHGSLFVKTLNTALTEDQRGAFEASNLSRMRLSDHLRALRGSAQYQPR